MKQGYYRIYRGNKGEEKTPLKFSSPNRAHKVMGLMAKNHPQEMWSVCFISCSSKEEAIHKVLEGI